jgi:hypothetical protein
MDAGKRLAVTFRPLFAVEASRYRTAMLFQ